MYHHFSLQMIQKYYLQVMMKVLYMDTLYKINLKFFINRKFIKSNYHR